MPRFRVGLNTRPRFGEAEINWGHPLCRGLAGYFLLNEPAGPNLNLVTPKVPWVRTTAAQKVSEQGIVYDYVGAGGRSSIGTSGALVLASPFSVFCIVRIAASASWSAVVGQGNNNDNFYVNPSSTTSVLQHGIYFSNWVCASNYTENVVLNSWNSFGVALNAASGSAYFNGAPNTGTAGGTSASFTVERIGYGGSGESFLGSIALVALWSGRRLTDAEMAYLHRNPYQVLKRRRRKTYFVIAAAPANPIPVGWRSRYMAREKNPIHVFQ